MSLAQAIVAYRQTHQLTQADLASQLFVTRQAVSAWEQGKAWPDAETLTKLNDLMTTDFAKPLPPETKPAPSDGMTVLFILIAVVIPVLGWVGPLIILFNPNFPRWSKITAGVVLTISFLVIAGVILLSLAAFYSFDQIKN
jgi:transcriptional regulator with XRE-family HTH domain